MNDETTALLNKIELVYQNTEPAERSKIINTIKLFMHQLTRNVNPVDCVVWVPIDEVQANDYNPNSVAVNEMRLLYTSIKHDGYTQPIVTIRDESIGKYIIVDGFHRFTTMTQNSDLREANGGLIPIVVLDKKINDRMASTVRHNRARGKHAVAGMANMVFNLLENGWSDGQVCGELGLEAEELARLKHVTGFSKLFESVEYRKSWETRKQILIRKEYENAQNQSS